MHKEKPEEGKKGDSKTWYASLLAAMPQIGSTPNGELAAGRTALPFYNGFRQYCEWQHTPAQ
eukprot:190555-Rhodomonas_salina.1